MLIAGIDLAWGEKNGDGVCLVEYQAEVAGAARARILAHDHVFGDEALLDSVLGGGRVAEDAVFLALDAPVVCVNATGRRPVDGAVSAAFRAQHAGCYPVNLRLAPRPLRLAARLRDEHGFALEPGVYPFGGCAGGTATIDLKGGQLMIDRKLGRRAVEVFPHPALVRFLGLERILEYKRKAGRARAHCEAEFRRLQDGVRGLLRSHFPWLDTNDETRELLEARWSKPTEDKVDALVCALIALWHVHHGGRRSEVFGDVATGFVIVPEAGSHVA